MSDLVKRLRAYKEPAPLRHDIAEAAATLEAQATEIERLRASELAKENERLKQWIDLHRGDTMSLSNEVENFRSEMIAAESRAEKAESALAEAVDVMRPFADIVGEAFLCSTQEWRDLVIAKPTGARLAFVRRDEFLNASAFIAEHGSDSKGE